MLASLVTSTTLPTTPFQKMEETTKVHPTSSAVHQSGVLWIDDGVFYARLPVLGDSQPLTVALHGVSDQTHAAEAYQVFLPLTMSAGFPAQANARFP